MTLALAPLPAWLDLDERRSERRPVAFETTMTEAAAPDPTAVQITDLSRFGCRVSFPTSTAVGRLVTIALPSSIAIEGVVAWFREGCAGLDFLRPLPEVLVDQLISRNPMAIGDDQIVTGLGDARPDEPLPLR